MKKGEEGTYALLQAAQEKEKGQDLFEAGVYAVFILTTVIAIWQFAAVAHPLKALGTATHHHAHKVHLAPASRPS
jgi:hypothetical protein